VAPVSKVICGVPLTVTASENVTVTFTASPALYAASVVVEVTPDTVAAVVSITIALLLAI